MSSAILTLLISHVLTFVESELLKEEPAIIDYLTNDIKSLISKLEALIEKKSPAAEAVAAPVLNAVGTAAVAAVDAAAQSVNQGN
jgi:hypothetical protein